MDLIKTGCWFVPALPIICGAGVASAQNGVIGTLVDARGGSIANAKVTATDEVQPILARETVTASTGEFRLLPQSPGPYNSVRAESAGM